MLYRNDSLDAILSMERARTGNYGADYDEYEESENESPYDRYDYEDRKHDDYMSEVRGLI